MTGNFSVLQDGSTLINDHHTTVTTLEDILAASNLDQAKSMARHALTKIGSLPTQGNPNPDFPVDKAEATGVQAKLDEGGET